MDKNKNSKTMVIVIVALCIAVIAVVAIVTAKRNGGGLKSEDGELISKNATIHQYKGLEYKGDGIAEVTDEDIMNQIDQFMSQNPIKTPITDRPIQEGDFVVADYTGSLDGVAFDGGSATDADIQVLSNKNGGGYVEGFAESFIGHNAGDEFDADVTFPDDYGNSDLAGKKTVFHMNVKSIYSQTTPELTDDYVKENVDGCSTVDEYKKQVKSSLEDSAKLTYESTLDNDIWNQVLENSEINEYPDEMIAKYKNKYTNALTTYAQAYGMSVDDYAEQYLGMTKEEYDKQVDQAAKDSVKEELVAEMIAEAEDLTLSEDEYKTRLDELASSVGYSSGEEYMEAASGTMDEEDIRMYILLEKVKDFCTENAIKD